MILWADIPDPQFPPWRELMLRVFDLSHLVADEDFAEGVDRSRIDRLAVVEAVGEKLGFEWDHIPEDNPCLQQLAGSSRTYYRARQEYLRNHQGQQLPAFGNYELDRMTHRQHPNTPTPRRRTRARQEPPAATPLFDL